MLTAIPSQRELNRIQNPKLNLLVVVKATAYELPYIPLRQSQKEVSKSLTLQNSIKLTNKIIQVVAEMFLTNMTQVEDYSQYFKIPVLNRRDVMQCPSGLVYLHIHR